MKILFAIDHFGSGGAQRQMVTLARELKVRGHEIEFFIYFPEHIFFRPLIEELQIPIYEYDKKSRGFSLGVLICLRRLLRVGNYDIALSYLDGPNLYLELASAGIKKTKIIVSERRSYLEDKNWFIGVFLRYFHRWADCVVTNSVSQKEWLIKKRKLSPEKVYSIYNGFDVRNFRPIIQTPNCIRDVKLIAIGRISPEKNLVNLVLGMRLFYQKNGWVPSLSWVGRQDAASQQHRFLIDSMLENSELKNKWFWLGERRDIVDLLKEHHALILPSLSEGLPNVVCEALLSGRPVLASNVCDNGRLVAHGERGYLFDPKKPESIADAIDSLVSVSEEQWMVFFENCRKYAERYLSIERLADEYEAIF
jgi:glycosyltransferase involved in cell wall biosynthesis